MGAQGEASGVGEKRAVPAGGTPAVAGAGKEAPGKRASSLDGDDGAGSLAAAGDAAGVAGASGTEARVRKGDGKAPSSVPPAFARPENEDDDGYDPWSDRPPRAEPLFERDPWD